MNMRTVLTVLLLIALVATLVVVGGCGKKQADTGTSAQGAAAPGAGAAGGPPPGMGGPAGGPPPGMGGPPGIGGAPSGGDAAALVDEGMAAKDAGDVDEAAAAFQEAIAADPSNEEAHWGLAWVLAQQKKNDEAIEEFEMVLEMTADPEHQSEAEAAIERLEK